MMEEIKKKYKEICKLFDESNPCGYSDKELNDVIECVGELPEALKYFYKKYGKTFSFFQDELMLPNKYPTLLNDEYLVFFNENQGICHAAVKKSDVSLIDPPVYINIDDNEWNLAADKLSDFMVAMYGYQASLCLEFNPEDIFFVSREEQKKIEERFTKRPETIKAWIDKDYEIILYGNDNGRIALIDMDGEDDIQMTYAANSQEELERMENLLSDIGEAI